MFWKLLVRNITREKICDSLIRNCPIMAVIIIHCDVMMMHCRYGWRGDCRMQMGVWTARQPSRPPWPRSWRTMSTKRPGWNSWPFFGHLARSGVPWQWQTWSAPAMTRCHPFLLPQLIGEVLRDTKTSLLFLEELLQRLCAKELKDLALALRATAIKLKIKRDNWEIERMLVSTVTSK